MAERVALSKRKEKLVEAMKKERDKLRSAQQQLDKLHRKYEAVLADLAKLSEQKKARNNVGAQRTGAASDDHDSNPEDDTQAGDAQEGALCMMEEDWND